MQVKPLLAPEDQDAQVQQGVLACVLTAYPEQFTEAELALELVGASPEFDERDAHQRAVRDLVCAGLLHHQGDLILPTRAARHFDGLA